MKVKNFLICMLVKFILTAKATRNKISDSTFEHDENQIKNNEHDGISSMKHFSFGNEDNKVVDNDQEDFGSDRIASILNPENLVKSGSDNEKSEVVSGVKNKIELETDELHSSETLSNSIYDNEEDLTYVVGNESTNKSNELSDANSKTLERLAKIVDRMDENKDGVINGHEIRNWIDYLQTRHVRADAERQFHMHDTNKDGQVNWHEYKETTYGILSKETFEDDYANSVYEHMIHRDERRWFAADRNGDGYCTKEEFYVFLHPEQFDHTHDVVVKETLEDLDKDKNGVVDVEEFIGDLMPGYNVDTEPEWITKERETFLKTKDLDGNGVVDEREVRAWIFPENYRRSDSEVMFLIEKADENNDGELSKAEILENSDVFMASQATEWGEILKTDEF